MSQMALKRKREVKLDNLIQANPKLLLVATTLFPPGTTQATLPFQLRPPTAQELGKGGFHINITIPLKDGGTLLATGWHSSRKEAEKQCAVSACVKLKAKGLLLLPEDSPADLGQDAASVLGAGGTQGPSGSHQGPSGSQYNRTAAQPRPGAYPGGPVNGAGPGMGPAGGGGGEKLPWSENPKNVLNASPVFKARLLRREPLPLKVSETGPPHHRHFIAQLDVPSTRDMRGPYVTVYGSGTTKANAERQCCVEACTHLFNLGLLDPSSIPGGSGHGPEGPQLPWLYLSPEEKAHLEGVLAAFDRESPSGPRPHWAGSGHATGAQGNGARGGPGYAQVPASQSAWSGNGTAAWGAADSDRGPGTAGPAGSGGGGRGSHQGSLMRDPALDGQFKTDALRRSTDPELKARMRGREALPAAKERHKIVDTIKKNKVSLIVGDTGCGKTTQVPQFILEDAEQSGTASEVHIVVTQPRRIAAVSVAERVAWERGESVGRSVGFSIRLENAAPRARGSIHFCTTGILLRRLQGGEGSLAGVSHVVIDEVHEREMDTDFLLILVREMLARLPHLRIVIMSATVETQLFSSYFSGCPVLRIPGNTFPVEVRHLDDLGTRVPGSMVHVVHRALQAQDRGDLGKGKEHDEDLDAELAAAVVLWVASLYANEEGAILCFLPSWDAIKAVMDRVSLSPGPPLEVIPLHSQVPQAEQKRAFAKPPPGRRKVVLATNIAETSITIDDVVFVVDGGKCKEKTFEPTRSMSTLTVEWISKASATQRQGRAGRVRAGKCFRLYTHQVYARMADHSVPEMQRVSLEELCLKIKALSSATNAGPSIGPSLKASPVFSSIATFLSNAPTPPESRAVRAAIASLQQLGAMDASEELTPLGATLGRLAVPPRFGKLLVYAGFFKCLDPVLGITAAASLTRDVFVTPLERRDESDEAKKMFAIGPASGSDHLTAIAAHYWWRSAWAEGGREGADFTSKHYLSNVALRNLSELKEKITWMLRDADILKPGDPDFGSTDQTAEALYVARCLLVAGLSPNIACSDTFQESAGKAGGAGKVRSRPGFRTAQGRVFLHPTSVVYRMDQDKLLPPQYTHLLVFNEKVQTSQLFVRGLTVVPPVALALFGSSLEFIPGNPQEYSLPGTPMAPGAVGQLVIEGWLRCQAENAVGALLYRLRGVLDWVTQKWLRGERREAHELAVVGCAVYLMSSAGREQSMPPSAPQELPYYS